MVAPIKHRRVVCTIVRIAAEEPAGALADDIGLVARRIAERVNRYGDDPLVSQLVERVKREAAEQSTDSATPFEGPQDVPHASPANRISRFYADLEPPSPAFDAEWEWQDLPRWSDEDEAPYDESYWWD